MTLNSSLESLGFASVYGGTSGPDALNHFLIPALTCSISYDRVAGYFSSAVFAQIASGITPLVRQGGKMRLVTSHSFTPRDIEAFSNGNGEEVSFESLAEEFELTVKSAGVDLTHQIRSQYVMAMCWLLREGQLEIRVVVPTKPSTASIEKFHSKFGILKDADGNRVVFSGSVNETWLAWSRNMENVSVYKSWLPALEPFVESYEQTFEELWQGQIQDEWRTVELPEAIRRRLIQLAPEGDFPNLDTLEGGEQSASFPRREPRAYQTEAVESWERHNRVGLLEMATGTGKTFTAKLCIDSAIESGSLLVVVVAPYQHIADQWANELSEFKPTQLGVRGSWRQELLRVEFNANLGLMDLQVVIAVKNTAASEDFVETISRISENFDNFLFVGDEVHWLGAPSLQAALNPKANFRLGLSATPDRYFDDEGTATLRSYFGPASVYTFGLEKALSWRNPHTGIVGVLTPYSYHPIFVSLTEEEESQFQELSQKIGQKSSIKEKTKQDQQEIEKLLLLRADIAKSAANKLPAYASLLQHLGSQLTQTLIYCADFQQMEEVMEISRKAGIDNSSRVTGLEGSSKSDYFRGRSEREHILKHFGLGNHDALFAIDCLDEGVDVPSAKMGIILASSGNPKEFVQRRGRLMRKAVGKTEAVIYDFVVLPKDQGGPESLRKVELKRIHEFAELAINRNQVLSDLSNY